MGRLDTALAAGLVLIGCYRGKGSSGLWHVNANNCHSAPHATLPKVRRSVTYAALPELACPLLKMCSSAALPQKAFPNAVHAKCPALRYHCCCA
mmetsp:Transcript_41170/g.69208  ORF Transcript_41170/g.69208 Transcript_41170/m.69208 type:complete len:94 (+) Transcript_41170:80-361(+)